MITSALRQGNSDQPPSIQPTNHSVTATSTAVRRGVRRERPALVGAGGNPTPAGDTGGSADAGGGDAEAVADDGVGGDEGVGGGGGVGGETDPGAGATRAGTAPTGAGGGLDGAKSAPLAPLSIVTRRAEDGRSDGCLARAAASAGAMSASSSGRSTS